MSEVSALVFALLAGAVLGAVFFGGLWWTISRCASSRRPALLFLGSLSLRAPMAIAGFYFVSHGDWRRTIACLAGFLVARALVTWLTRVPVEQRTHSVGDGAA
jgi:F1F0 ATPase subunit 2